MGQMIRRVEGWPIALSAELKRREKMPFVWGENDCMMFAADCIYIMSGIDFAADFRGKYDSREGADAIIAEYGTVIKMLSHILDCSPERNFMLATRGDVALVSVNGTDAVGVVDDTGRRVAVLTESGLARVGKQHVKWIWRW